MQALLRWVLKDGRNVLVYANRSTPHHKRQHLSGKDGESSLGQLQSL